MKMKKAVFMAVLLLAATGLTALIAALAGRKEERPGLLCATSFYPVYLLAESVAEGAEDVEVVNLTENHGGCIHDYTLTTQDMRLLSEAELLLLNGGGMELFLSKAAEDYKNLMIVDTSEGYNFLEGVVHVHETGDVSGAHPEETGQDGHSHVLNAHLWLDIDGYLFQLSKIEEAFVAADPAQAELYRQNAEDCRQALAVLREEYDEGKRLLSGRETVVFHEGFVYLFRMLGVGTVHCLAMDSDTQISAGEAAEIVEECRRHGVTRLFAEADYEKTVADTFAAETGAAVFVLDAVTGGKEPEAAPEGGTPAGLALYCAVMRRNLETIKQAYELR